MELNDSKSMKIQLLRGLAIIAVVFIHSTPNGLTQVFCRPLLNFSVGLFLFLSGMLSDINKWNPKKRLVKVLIPYMLWTLIYVILSNMDTPTLIPILFLKNLVTGNAAAVMYYIFVYSEFTLLIPFIDKLAKSKYKFLGFLITPTEIILLRMIPLISGYEINRYIKLIMGISCLGWFTYYYFGYLLGNRMIKITTSTNRLIIYCSFAIVLQVLEGYWYYSMGEENCGTQLKLSSILTGVIISFLAYRFINSAKNVELKWLYLLGNFSFGIYFSHLAIMTALNHIPYYSVHIFYPLNAIIIIVVSICCVFVGKKMLGKYSKYLAL